MFFWLRKHKAYPFSVKGVSCQDDMVCFLNLFCVQTKIKEEKKNLSVTVHFTRRLDR